MNTMSNEALYEFYKDTINRCGSYLLHTDDETIGYSIFEEFDVGVVSFLHESSLNKLFDGGFISDSEMESGLQLRRLVFDLHNTDEWSIDAFKTSEKWKRIMELSDKIREM